MSRIPEILKRKTVINVGNFGQPRDVNPDAAFIVYDSKVRTLGVHRFGNDLSFTLHKIRENDLPLD